MTLIDFTLRCFMTTLVLFGITVVITKFAGIRLRQILRILMLGESVFLVFLTFFLIWTL